MAFINNVDFSDLIVNFCGMMTFHDLTELKTTKERIEYCKNMIVSCEDDIAHFNKRKQKSNYRQQCDIEIWISEREDRINVAVHYLNNIIE
jgi:hypothetical protein